MTSHCQECGARLWSEHAKTVALCPDCEDIDSDGFTDLEDRLQQLLHPTTTNHNHKGT